MNRLKSVIELPDRAFLQECFRYDEDSGKLYWLERPRHHFKETYAWERFKLKNVGKEAGIKMTRENGEPLCLRVKFHFNGKKLFPSNHRVIFALKGIEVPEGVYIDHRDGNPFNNAWGNLRIATNQQNQWNKRNAITRKHALPKGVHNTRYGKFRATCSRDGKVKHIGVYDTPEEAHQAYCSFSENIRGEFHRGS